MAYCRIGNPTVTLPYRTTTGVGGLRVGFGVAGRVGRALVRGVGRGVCVICLRVALPVAAGVKRGVSEDTGVAAEGIHSGRVK